MRINLGLSPRPRKKKMAGIPHLIMKQGHISLFAKAASVVFPDAIRTGTGCGSVEAHARKDSGFREGMEAFVAAFVIKPEGDPASAD